MSPVLLFALFSSPADARDTPHWWLVRDKVAIGQTARAPASTPEEVCAGLMRSDIRTCTVLVEKSTALMAKDRSLQADLQEKGVVFSHSGLMLVGGTSQGYGDILINAEPIEFE